jgi:hypothetical protein
MVLIMTLDLRAADVLRGLRAPYEATIARLDAEISLEPLKHSNKSPAEIQIRQREVRQRIKQEQEAAAVCSLKYIVEQCISTGLENPPLQFPVLKYYARYVYSLSCQVEGGPKRVYQLVRDVLSEYTPRPYQILYHDQVGPALHDIFLLSLPAVGRRPYYPADFDVTLASCMEILRERFRLRDRIMALRRNRSVVVVQRAYMVHLFRRTRAAKVIQRSFQRYRFRPGGPLSERTVKRLRDQAAEMSDVSHRRK